MTATHHSLLFDVTHEDDTIRLTELRKEILNLSSAGTSNLKTLPCVRFQPRQASDRSVQSIASPLLRVLLAIAVQLLITAQAKAQDTPCAFNESSLSFAGTPLQQATCLLRPVRQGGHLDTPLKKLPAPLNRIIGTRMIVKKAVLRRYLAAHDIAEMNIGGSLDESLSPATLPN